MKVDSRNRRTVMILQLVSWPRAMHPFLIEDAVIHKEPINSFDARDLDRVNPFLKQILYLDLMLLEQTRISKNRIAISLYQKGRVNGSLDIAVKLRSLAAPMLGTDEPQLGLELKVSLEQIQCRRRREQFHVAGRNHRSVGIDLG